MKKKSLLFICLLVVASCSKNDKTIKVGASATPHAEILEQAKDYIESQGYKLDIVVFDDYVMPNFALDSGELDANYFQHEPYLKEFNAQNGTTVYSVGKIHFEPLGVYSKKHTKLQNELKVIIPSDKSNNDRARQLLKDLDVSTNNIVEVEAQYIPVMLDDCDYALINGNYALSSKVTDYLIASEDSNSDIANKMANVIAVKEETKKTKVLLESLRQPNIEEFINDKYKGTVKYVKNN